MNVDEVAASPAASPAAPGLDRGAALWAQRGLLLLTQAASIVFAVLIALAVDQWWESRENAQLARDAMTAVAEELRGNLAELDQGRDKLSATAASLGAVLPDLRSDSDTNVSVDYEVALLSAAAWQTAQFTRAIHFVPLDRAARLARVYELQTFVTRNQDALTDRLTSLSGHDEQALGTQLRDIHGRLVMIGGLRDALALSYRCMIAELEGAAALPECQQLEAGT